MIGCEVDGDESQPYDAGGVHGEGDILGLVEVLWDFARLEGVDSAENDEADIVGERADGAHLACTALEHQEVALVGYVLRGWLLEAQPRDADNHLKQWFIR